MGLEHSKITRAWGGARSFARPPMPGAEVVVAGPFLYCHIEVVVSRDAEFHGRRDDRLDQLVPPRDRRAPQRAAEAVEGGVSARGVLEALEVRQHVGIAPAVVAESRPAIVILMLAANRDQPIDRTGSAERLAARPVDSA